MNKIACLSMLLAACLTHGQTGGEAKEESKELKHSVSQLRQSIGDWNVETQFLKPDGRAARTLQGTYHFEWVVEDRVVSGRSSIPELQMASGLLFYVNEATGTVEMVSVGKDGKLWIMTGPLGGETRTTQEYETANGGTGQLRFTRYNVEPDRFESKMEYTSDGRKTWVPGNHQTFVRKQ